MTFVFSCSLVLFAVSGYQLTITQRGQFVIHRTVKVQVNQAAKIGKRGPG